MKNYIYGILFVIISLFISISVNAELIYSGILQYPNTIAVSPWDGVNGARLEYTVDQTDNVFTYSYTFYPNSVKPKNLSHIIIELSDGFTEDDFINISTNNWEINTYHPTDPSNQGLPYDIYGIKFEDITSFSFSTLNQPQWGDVYARDGRQSSGAKNFIYMYNSGFTSGNNGPHFLDDPTLVYSNLILHPNSVPDDNGGGGGQGGEEVPIPSTLVLYLTGIVCLFRRYVF